MSQSCLHLIAFALVAVLCVCMVTSVSVSTVQQPEISTTQKSSTVLENELKSIVSESDSETTLYVSKLETTTSPDTPTLHSTNKTHEDDHNIGNEDSRKDTRNSSITTESTITESATTKSATMKSTTMKSTTTKSATMKSTVAGAQSQSGSGGKIAGVFFLIFIFIVIIILAVVLYILWKRGKRYSFDLTNDEHETLPIDQIGTFEQAKGSTMNLDCNQEDYPNKSSPVANGCSGETPEQTPCSEQQSAPEEDSFSSDLSELNSPVKKVEFNLDLELIGGELELEKPEADEPTDNDNENNNNETNTGNNSADLFTEINLDDTQ